MHEVTLLIDIAVALVVAFIGGVLARRIGLPTIVGYLLAGIVIGPFTPGFMGDAETISAGQNIASLLGKFGVPHLVVEADVERVGLIGDP